MVALVKAGKIRHWGCRTRPPGASANSIESPASSACPGPATLQNSYSLVSRQVEGDLAEVLHRERMSLLAYSPLAAGCCPASTAAACARRARASRCSTRSVRAFASRSCSRRSRRSSRSPSGADLSPVQLALGYVRSRYFVGAQIIGATTLAQLDENLAAAQFDLDAATLAEIDALLVRYPNPRTDARARSSTWQHRTAASSPRAPRSASASTCSRSGSCSAIARRRAPRAGSRSR
jgi:aryl-alcohol dehydrogenase-like predicted oxidoreductase